MRKVAKRAQVETSGSHSALEVRAGVKRCRRGACGAQTELTVRHQRLTSLIILAAAASAVPGLSWAQPAPNGGAVLRTTAQPDGPADGRAGGEGAAPAGDSREAVRRDLQNQVAILNDPAAPPQAREEAARRLVSRDTPEAKEILLGILRDNGRIDAQLAVARGLASDPTPDADFITPLGNLLGANQPLTEAAGRALANFKASAEARDRLLRFVNTANQSERGREAVTRAMGGLVDQRTAAGLIDLINKPDESSRVRSAAFDALLEMTGETRNGRDVQRWNTWWSASRNMGPAQWANEVLANKSVRLTDYEKRLNALLRSYDTELRRQFASVPEAERGAFIAARLADASEDVRLIGADLASEEMAQGRRNPQVLAALRERIGDSSVEVRRRVASTLRAWNDPGAVDALLAQLAQETDTDVRIELIRALGPTRDLRAVDPLMRLLGEDVIAVSKAAADALKDPAMAAELRKPANADQFTAVANALLARLATTRANTPEVRPLRLSIAEAMGYLGHPSFKQSFAELVNPKEEPNDRVRVAALRGLELLADPNLSNWVLDALRDDAGTVRLAACLALRTSGTYENAQSLRDRLSSSTEADPTVRQAAWETLLALLEKAPEPENLDFWIQAFAKANPTVEDRQRRIAILTIQEKMLAARPDSQRELALARQTLGDELLRLSQMEEAGGKAHAEAAAARFRAALTYWEESGGAVATVRDTLSQQYVEALLRARQFDAASKFVSTAIASGIDVGVMWRKSRDEIQRLIKLEDWETAGKLIDEVEKIAWTDLYSPALKTLKTQVANKQRSGGFIWVRHGSDDFPVFAFPMA